MSRANEKWQSVPIKIEKYFDLDIERVIEKRQIAINNLIWDKSRTGNKNPVEIKK